MKIYLYSLLIISCTSFGADTFSPKQEPVITIYVPCFRSRADIAKKNVAFFMEIPIKPSTTLIAAEKQLQEKSYNGGGILIIGNYKDRFPRLQQIHMLENPNESLLSFMENHRFENIEDLEKNLLFLLPESPNETSVEPTSETIRSSQPQI